jgi:uncharacterized protein (DUF486 family)
MTTDQGVLSVAGLLVTLFGLGIAFFKYYIDAKLDPIGKNVDMLVQYMILHEGKIARLEERTGGQKAS